MIYPDFLGFYHIYRYPCMDALALTLPKKYKITRGLSILRNIQ